MAFPSNRIDISSLRQIYLYDLRGVTSNTKTRMGDSDHFPPLLNDIICFSLLRCPWCWLNWKRRVHRRLEMSTSIISVHSCASFCRQLSVHSSGVAAVAVRGGQNQSSRCWYRLQRRDRLQDHGRRRARHVQHNNRWGHTRGGHYPPKGSAGITNKLSGCCTGKHFTTMFVRLKTTRLIKHDPV